MIKSTKGDITQKVKTVLKGSEGGPYDVVLLTCKAYDLDSAIAAIAPAVGPNTTVVPLLNGMRHLDVLDAKFGKDKVVGGLARVGVAHVGRGHDPAHQPVRRDLLRRARRQARAPVAGRARCGDQEVRHRRRRCKPNIVQDLWDKWIMLCSLAATCCLMRGSSGDILEADEGQAIVLETVEECHKVAAAAGHDPGDKGMQTIRVVPDREGLALHRLDAARPREGRDGRGRPCRGRHDRARRKRPAIATPNLRMAYAHLQVYLASPRRRPS